MIKSAELHNVTLGTDDKRTANLADAVHNMGEWHSTGLMTSDMFVHIHDILRANLGTENFLSVVGYRDEREENNEYHILIAEFPEKSDGTIRSLKKGEEDFEFYLLTKEEALFEAIEKANTNTTDKKEQN